MFLTNFEHGIMGTYNEQDFQFADEYVTKAYDRYQVTLKKAARKSRKFKMLDELHVMPSST